MKVKERTYNNRGNIHETEDKQILYRCSDCKNYFIKEDMNNTRCKECNSEYNYHYYIKNKERKKEKNLSEESKRQKKEATKKFHESYLGDFLYFYTIPLSTTELEMCVYTGKNNNVYKRNKEHLSLRNKDGVAYKVKQVYGLDKSVIRGYAFDLTKYNLTVEQIQLLEHYMILWFKANRHCLFNDKKVERYFTEREMVAFEEVKKLLEIDYLHPKHFISIEEVIDSKRERRKYKKRK